MSVATSSRDGAVRSPEHMALSPIHQNKRQQPEQHEKAVHETLFGGHRREQPGDNWGAQQENCDNKSRAQQGACGSKRRTPQRKMHLQQLAASLAPPGSDATTQSGMPVPCSQPVRDFVQWRTEMNKKLSAQAVANRKRKSGYISAIPAELQYHLACACKHPFCRKITRMWHQLGGPPSFPLPHSLRRKMEKRLGPLKMCKRMQLYHFRSEHRKTARHQLMNARRPGGTMGIEIAEEAMCDPTMEPDDIEREMQLVAAIKQHDAGLFDIVGPHIFGESDMALSIADLQAIVAQLHDISAAKELVLKLIGAGGASLTNKIAQRTGSAEEDATPVDEEADDSAGVDEDGTALMEVEAAPIGDSGQGEEDATSGNVPTTCEGDAASGVADGVPCSHPAQAGRAKSPPNHSITRLHAAPMEVDDAPFCRSAREKEDTTPTTAPADAKLDEPLQEDASTTEPAQAKDDDDADARLAARLQAEELQVGGDLRAATERMYAGFAAQRTAAPDRTAAKEASAGELAQTKDNDDADARLATRLQAEELEVGSDLKTATERAYAEFAAPRTAAPDRTAAERQPQLVVTEACRGEKGYVRGDGRCLARAFAFQHNLTTTVHDGIMYHLPEGVDVRTDESEGTRDFLNALLREVSTRGYNHFVVDTGRTIVDDNEREYQRFMAADLTQSQLPNNIFPGELALAGLSLMHDVVIRVIVHNRHVGYAPVPMEYDCTDSNRTVEISYHTNADGSGLHFDLVAQQPDNPNGDGNGDDAPNDVPPQSKTDDNPEAAVATSREGAAALDAGALDDVDFGSGAGDEWDTTSSSSDDSDAESESDDSYTSSSDNEEFTFDGKAYPSYQDMVDAKRTARQKNWADAVADAKTPIDAARRKEQEKRTAARKKKRDEKSKAPSKPPKRSRRLAGEEFDPIFLEKDGGGEVVIRGKDGQLFDGSELEITDDTIDMDIPEHAGKGVAVQDDLQCNHFAPRVDPDAIPADRNLAIELCEAALHADETHKIDLPKEFDRRQFLKYHLTPYVAPAPMTPHQRLKAKIRKCWIARRRKVKVTDDTAYFNVEMYPDVNMIMNSFVICNVLEMPPAASMSDRKAWNAVLPQGYKMENVKSTDATDFDIEPPSFDHPTYCNSRVATDYTGMLRIHLHENGVATNLRLYIDTVESLPQTEVVGEMDEGRQYCKAYFLVRDLLSVEQVQRLINHSQQFNPELLPIDVNEYIRMEAKTFTNAAKFRIHDLIDEALAEIHIVRSAQAHCRAFALIVKEAFTRVLSQMPLPVNVLDRLAWRFWATCIAEGEEQWFTTEAVKARRATRDSANPDAPQGLLLETLRIIAHSQRGYDNKTFKKYMRLYLGIGDAWTYFNQFVEKSFDDAFLFAKDEENKILDGGLEALDFETHYQINLLATIDGLPEDARSLCRLENFQHKKAVLALNEAMNTRAQFAGVGEDSHTKKVVEYFRPRGVRYCYTLNGKVRRRKLTKTTFFESTCRTMDADVGYFFNELFGVIAQLKKVKPAFFDAVINQIFFLSPGIYHDKVCKLRGDNL